MITWAYFSVAPVIYPFGASRVQAQPIAHKNVDTLMLHISHSNTPFYGVEIINFK